MKKLNFIFLLFLAITLFTFTSCDDDEGVDVNDVELITTVTLQFNLPDGTDAGSFTIRDTDGDGGNPPVKESINLSANTGYLISAQFFDESDPADVEDITEEVNEEDDEHLVCYTASGLSAPFDLNTDSNGDLLGTTAAITTGDAGTGTLQIVLKHEPDKSATDACATGETDVEVIFDVVVQ
ncbi:MAG: type 1 periplasmic binding fold superfamily protein [Bacteroidota bacterium]